MKKKVVTKLLEVIHLEKTAQPLGLEIGLIEYRPATEQVDPIKEKAKKFIEVLNRQSPEFAKEFAPLLEAMAEPPPVLGGPEGFRIAMFPSFRLRFSFKDFEELGKPQVGDVVELSVNVHEVE